MDSPETIADTVLRKLHRDPSRDTAFTRCLRASIEVAIEASLFTDEGQRVTFSLLMDLDEGGPPDPGAGTDASWRPEIQCEPRRRTARELAADSRLSKAGETFFYVKDAEDAARGPEERPTIWISGITRPPRTFSRELLGDRRHLGLTVLGPFHFIIEANGREALYVRAGQISHHDSQQWPREVGEVLHRRCMGVDPQMRLTEGIIRHTFNMIGRAMWLSATGGTVAILAPNDSEQQNAGNWSLNGEGLDVPELFFSETTYDQGKVECEQGGDYERALEYAALARNAEIAADDGAADLTRFTQLDGAVVLHSDLTLAGFGRKLEPDYQQPLHYIKTDEITGSRETKVSSLGGTRHKSAAHWVADAPGRLALVASQDRRLGWVFNATEAERAVEYWPWRPRLF